MALVNLMHRNASYRVTDRRLIFLLFLRRLQLGVYYLAVHWLNTPSALLHWRPASSVHHQAYFFFFFYCIMIDKGGTIV